MSYGILVVDDSSSALMMYRKIIEVSGIPVRELTTARNGQEALQQLALHSIDLILTDLHMPVMDGLQLLEHLAAEPKWRPIPVIMITSEGRSEAVERSKALGAAGVLQKPFTPEEVRRVMLDCLGVQDHGNTASSTEKGDF
ncbi:MAG TPA: response regulator [Candidatus Aminicenantes bacterium]|nr:response regulator [Candidatus Aminicenantes bacterium]